MKKIIIVLFILTGGFLFGQKTPEAFLEAAPKHNNICGMDENARAKFNELTADLMSKIEAELKAKNDFVNEPENEAEMQQNMLSQLGVDISAEDMKKLEDENLSEEERTRIEAKIMKQVMEKGVNIGNNDEIQAKYHESQKVNEIVQDAMTGKLAEIKGNFPKIKTEAEAFYKKNIKPLEDITLKEFHDGEMSSEKEANKKNDLYAKIVAQKKIYCEKFSPKYSAVLQQFADYIKINLSKIREAETSAMKTVGLENMDVMALEYVLDYYTFLKDATQYNIVPDETK